MKKIIGYLCIFILSYVAMKPLLSPGYFPMHDDTQVARVVVMGKALREGQFPVRWVSDLGYGYGYPIFNFYGPLPYYVGGGLYALGVDSVTATKIMFGIGMVLAPMTLFLLVESILGFSAAIVSSVLFLYAPYHAVEMYIRGSIGEYWAIAFMPLLLYGIKMSFQKKPQVHGIVIGSIALAGVIVSHTLLGFITCIFLIGGYIVYWSVLLIQKKLHFSNCTDPVLLVFLGLGLSAFFWLPAVVEMSYTSVSQMIGTASTTFFDHFVCVGQLWNSQWGFAGSAPGCIDGMSFKLGKVQVVMLVSSLVGWITLRKKQSVNEKNVFMALSVLGLAVSVFLMLQPSSFIWKRIPFTSFIQYPWRLLSFAMLFIAMAGAYSVSLLHMRIVRIIFAIGIVIVTISINAKIFVPQYTYIRDSSAFETQEELRFTKSKISDEYLPPGIVKPITASDIARTAIEGNAVFFIRSLKEQDTSLYAEVESKIAQTILIRKAWFPGWKIQVDGKEIQPRIERGFPSVNIPGGKSIIRMQFADTPVRTVGNIVSICAVSILGVALIYGKKTNA